jgi:hypothetical protein
MAPAERSDRRAAAHCGGELAIDAVEPISPGQLTDADARAAGFASRAEAVAELDTHRQGDLYRIRLRLAGPDTRVALREQATLSAGERDDLHRRLARLDRASRCGPWTDSVLRLIQANEALPARELAKRGGFGREWLKLKLRKLKNLGLTQSLHRGYHLSPRGRAWLRQRSARNSNVNR